MSAARDGTGAAPPHTAVLFQTHFFNNAVERVFKQLAGQCPPGYDPLVLIHLPPRVQPPRRLRRHNHFVVRTPELHDLGYPAKCRYPSWNIFDGHTDLIILKFFLERPKYDQYWSIEYDMRFSGSWDVLFRHFEANEAHYLTTTIRVYEEADASWPYWNSLKPLAPLRDDQKLRSFQPIFRTSDAALAAMDRAYRDGWGGHSETTWPTILKLDGMRVEDIGGDGPFTPAENVNRFYTNTPNHVHLSPGSLVYRPVRRRAGKTPNMLWHPVKPFHLANEFARHVSEVRKRLKRTLRNRGFFAQR